MNYFKQWYKSEAGKKYIEANRAKRNEQHRKYQVSEKGKEVQRRKSNKMRLKFPEKWKARSKLRYEVKMGRIVKLPCEVCGELKVQGHHEDYSKPLDVIWLCDYHHKIREGKLVI